MQFLLDTNVVSELTRAVPNPAVDEWVADQNVGDLFFSTVGEAEIRAGAATLPSGRRRKLLISKIDNVLNNTLRNRVLPFDRRAACTHAKIWAQRRSAGRPPEFADCQIAAIARSRGMAVATRNIRDFEGTGVEIVNPWEPE